MLHSFNNMYRLYTTTTTYDCGVWLLKGVVTTVHNRKQYHSENQKKKKGIKMKNQQTRNKKKKNRTLVRNTFSTTTHAQPTGYRKSNVYGVDRGIIGEFIKQGS